MNSKPLRCVLLADRNYGLMEGVRGLLETSFDVVAMVADGLSLLEATARLQPQMAVIDLSLACGEVSQWLSRLKHSCPGVKLVVLSVHDESVTCRTAMAAGADAFVLKRALGTELLTAVGAVMAGQTFVSPGISSNKGAARA